MAWEIGRITSFPELDVKEGDLIELVDSAGNICTGRATRRFGGLAFEDCKWPGIWRRIVDKGVTLSERFTLRRVGGVYEEPWL